VAQSKRDDPATWTTALEDLSPVLTRLEDPDRWLASALEEAPTSRVIEIVAKALDDLGRRSEAVGLLELAWQRSPGDRRLKRARRRLGMPGQVDPGTGRPWEEVHDPLTGATRIASPVDPSISLEGARAEGERFAERHQALVTQTVAWLETGDRRALDPLLFFSTGVVDRADDDAVTTVFQELAQVPGGRELPWLPPEVAQALVAEPKRIDRLRKAHRVQ
ncbi:MAG: hypothetical protein AAF602_31205, partial [Myxococcota bacterium]